MQDILTLLLSERSLLLFGAGFVISTFAVVFGASMFISTPFLQSILPGSSFGVIVGNLKVGSFFRSIGSTYATRSQIEYIQNFQIGILAILGTIFGASLISQLDQKWVFPAVVVAIIIAIVSPKIATKITKKTFHIISFLTGVYAGVFGAGISILLVALLRTKYPADTQIAFVKIQARFLEFLLVVSAVIAHILHGNIFLEIWLPWSIGALIGGVIGGHLLQKIGNLPGNIQRAVLYSSFALALIVSGGKFFEKI